MNKIPKPPSFDLWHFYPYQFDLVVQRTARIVDRLLARVELTRPELRVMIWTHLYPDVSGTVIARSLMMDKSRVVRAVESLVKRDLLIRRSNPDDRRENLLRLNEAGEKVYAEASRVLSFIQGRMESALSEEERRCLGHVLIKFDGVLNQLDAELD